jgi:hypothetical protein
MQVREFRSLSLLPDRQQGKLGVDHWFVPTVLDRPSCVFSQKPCDESRRSGPFRLERRIRRLRRQRRSRHARDRGAGTSWTLPRPIRALQDFLGARGQTRPRRTLEKLGSSHLHAGDHYCATLREVMAWVPREIVHNTRCRIPISENDTTAWSSAAPNSARGCKFPLNRLWFKVGATAAFELAGVHGQPGHTWRVSWFSVG